MPRFAPSWQTHWSPLRPSTPSLQAVGLPVHELPIAQLTHVAVLEQKPPGQVEPGVRFAPSTHTGAPVEHCVVPVLHGFGFPMQLMPAVHATQVPALLHTWFTPHDVPGARFIIVSLHVTIAPLQSCAPTRHAVGFPVHAEPCTHAPQVPPLHVCPLPHVVPFITFTVLSAHTGVPEPQRVAPTLHAVGLPVQTAPSVQPMHAPTVLHTMFAPHGVPGVRSIAVFSQTGAPLAQRVMPCLQTIEFVVHAWFSVHATH